MSSRHLVDPELAPLIDLLPAFTLRRENLPAIREGLLESLAQSVNEEDGVDVIQLAIPGQENAPDVQLTIYRPGGSDDALPAVLHFHGGGHIMGAPAISAARNRVLAQEAGCAIVSVHYRLSPENPFPAALDDAYAALRWLYEDARRVQIDPSRIAVAGESAGAGLAAALTQLARDKGEVRIVFQLLIYPMLDNRSGRTIDRGSHSGEFLWTPESNRFAWDALLGEGHAVDDERPYAVPGRCEHLAGLPAAFIGVGALDLFAEEDIDYAQRLVHAGVPTELHVYPGAFHGFDAAPGTWAAHHLAREATAALRRALHPRPASAFEGR